MGLIKPILALAAIFSGGMLALYLKTRQYKRWVATRRGGGNVPLEVSRPRSVTEERQWRRQMSEPHSMAHHGGYGAGR